MGKLGLLLTFIEIDHDCTYKVHFKVTIKIVNCIFQKYLCRTHKVCLGHFNGEVKF